MNFSKSLQIRNTLTMGRGVFALQPILKGKVLLKLQEDNYITYDDLDSHSFFCQLIGFKPQQKDRKTQFAFYLAFVHQNMQNKTDRNQKIIKYIEDLPNYFNALICWQKEELNLIDDFVLKERINQKRKQIQNSYNAIKKYLTEPSKNNQLFMQSEDEISTQQIDEEQSNINKVYKVKQNMYKRLCEKVTLDKVIYFYAAIQSRRIYQSTTHDLKNQIGALVPLLELFNHSLASHVKKYDHYVKAEVNIEKQQQFQPEYLFETYGIVDGVQYKKVNNSHFQDEIQIQEQRRLLAQGYNVLKKSKLTKVCQN